MDDQSKTRGGVIDGIEETGGNQATARSNTDFILRIFALVLTLAAAIVLVVDNQTKIVQINIVESLPPLNIPVHAKWHYLSAFVFFVVSNAIACSYAAVSLLLSSVTRKGLSPLVMILDLLVVALLFSGNGAATAIGLLGFRGNSHVRWNKVCNVFGKFCNQVAVAIVLSLLGSIVFLLLIALVSFRLHKKCNK